MKKLLDGIRHFQSDSFPRKQELFGKLAGGQTPLALFITCSDSRIDPNLLTETEPGELFVLRVAGNIVPPYGAVEGGEAATIEYAVRALGIRDIVVCGHSHCGAMGGLLAPDAVASMPAVQAYLRHAESTRRVIEENYAHITDAAERLALAVEENVLAQLNNLRTHPAVAAGLGRGELSLHGWVYAFETGAVQCYDPAQREFRPLDEGTTV